MDKTDKMMHNSFSNGMLEAPAIPGLVFRHLHSEVDLPGIVDVMNASFAADGNSERITVEGLANNYAHPVHWDPQQDTLLVEVERTLVGYANTEWCEEAEGDCLHNINLHLVEEWRSRGLERAVQCYLEQRAKVIASAGSTGARHWYASRVPETWCARAEMLLALDYTPTRYYFEMQRSLDDDLPKVMMPAGIELRSPLPEHYRAIWEANAECFADQRDYVAPSEESYYAWVTTPDLDPSLWLVAWDGDQVAGGAINVAYGGVWGETDDLFVRRPWRNQGLGRALLVGSLHLFKARGLTTAGLGVDAENLSGALGLYESVGFRPYQRVVSYRKQM
jgi:GNAT superfamily N-acetyltransferase